MNHQKKIYSHINELPIGQASGKLTAGCLVLEGGAWRGLYTQGVLDSLMENDINLQTTIGVSAGAMAGMNYVSGQIGRSIRINLTYRHDQNYVGSGAALKDHGITGFTYLFGKISDEYPLNVQRFNDPARRFIAVATRIRDAQPVFFEKGHCASIEKAVQASATVPYISKPVKIGDDLYLDGGITDPIPYDFALNEKSNKIVVVRTRDRSYRKDGSSPEYIIKTEYRKYPELEKVMLANTERYNHFAEELNRLEKDGRVFVIAPDIPLDIPRFEGDLNKLADLYYLGYENGEKCLPALKNYLNI